MLLGIVGEELQLEIKLQLPILVPFTIDKRIVCLHMVVLGNYYFDIHFHMV